MIRALQDWVKGYELTAELPESRIPELEALLSTARQEHEKLEKQKTRLYDLLEQGIYDSETFLERSRRLQDRLQESQAGIVRLEADLAAEEKIQANLTSFLPSCRDLLGCYWASGCPGPQQGSEATDRKCGVSEDVPKQVGRGWESLV